MLVTRKSAITIEPKDLRIGDSIVVFRSKGASFCATVHEVTDTSVLFLADESVVRMSMSKSRTDNTPFGTSDVNMWLYGEFYQSLPEEIKGNLIELSIPTYGMIFGHDKLYERFKPDKDECLSLMAIRKYRISDYDNAPEWWWLRNASKKKETAMRFAVVDCHGRGTYSDVDVECGVRPYFRIKK